MTSLCNEQVFAREEVYFGSARDFNDPFDCHPRLKTKFTGKEISKYSAYLQKKYLGDQPHSGRKQKAAEIKALMKNRRELERRYFERIEDFGLYCLSETCENILMWSHYADNHRGFCLEFGGREPQSSPFQAVLPIKYQEDRPIVDITVTADDEDTPKIVQLGLLTKSLDWKYEKEWRAWDGERPGPRVLKAGSLSAVILGARITPEDREKLFYWVGQHRLPLEIREARLSSDHFRLKIVTCKTA